MGSANRRSPVLPVLPGFTAGHALGVLGSVEVWTRFDEVVVDARIEEEMVELLDVLASEEGMPVVEGELVSASVPGLDGPRMDPRVLFDFGWVNAEPDEV